MQFWLQMAKIHQHFLTLPLEVEREVVITQIQASVVDLVEAEHIQVELEETELQVRDFPAE